MTKTDENKTIEDRANDSYRSFARHAGRQVRICIQADDHGWHDTAEAIRESIREDPLSLTIDEVDPHYDQVRWNLLLGTGGPAVRILVTTDLRGVIEDADYQFQDWFTPWTTASVQDDEIVKGYAEMFYYGMVEVTLDGNPID